MSTLSWISSLLSCLSYRKTWDFPALTISWASFLNPPPPSIFLCICMHAQMLSCVWLFVTPWTVAHQSSLSMGSSWKDYWSGLPFPPLGDFHNPGMKPVSAVSPELAGRFFTWATWEDPLCIEVYSIYISLYISIHPCNSVYLYQCL